MAPEEQVLWEIGIPLRTFLTIPICPPRWKAFDLYLFRDADNVFYVGQSYCAFERVWEHIRSGPKGHSIIGRFILGNWPRSGHFTIRLLSSQSPRFVELGNNLDLAERELIKTYTPCFNVALNSQPVPLPEGYAPPNAPIKFLKSYKRMLREAGYAPRANPEDVEWE